MATRVIHGVDVERVRVEVTWFGEYHAAAVVPPAEAARLGAVASVVEEVAQHAAAAGRAPAAALAAALDELAWIAGAVRLTADE